MLQHVAIEATYELRFKIYRRILNVSIEELETIGPAKLQAVFASDVPRLMTGAAALPSILISSATIIGLLGFLIYLNLDVFWFILATIIFGIFTYRIPLFFGARYYTVARNSYDGIQEGIRGLLYGAKELKLNRKKSEEYVQELRDYEGSLSKESKKGIFLITAGLNYGNLISFFAIGVATFVLSNHYSVSSSNLVAIVMALLYVTGPLGAILNSISPVVQGNVALRKLNEVLEAMPSENLGFDTRGSRHIEQIDLQGVTYSYQLRKRNGSSFNIGPIDLTLKKGEITFLVGGNGSGKSTLGKIISLHYVPNKGKVIFGNELLTKNNRDFYRQYISAIYTCLLYTSPSPRDRG